MPVVGQPVENALLVQAVVQSGNGVTGCIGRAVGPVDGLGQHGCGIGRGVVRPRHLRTSPDVFPANPLWLVSAP